MEEETTTIKFNEPLARRIEAFLEQHPEYGNLEEFVTAAGRIRREQLAATLPQDPATGPQTRDEEYSHGTLDDAWQALNRTGPPLTAEEKTRLIKDLAASYRRLKDASLGATDRGGIQ
jgi:hypothetical protein